MKLYKSHSVGETQKLAQKILTNLKVRNLICLYGELGSGKTTFVKGLAKALGIKDRVISPTFVIIRDYKIKDLSLITNHLSLLIHIDCYRVESEKDIKSFDLKEYWSCPTNLVVIEWAEKIKQSLPKDRIDIKFKYIGKDKREIFIK